MRILINQTSPSTSPPLSLTQAFGMSFICTTFLTLIMGWTSTSGVSIFSSESIWYQGRGAVLEYGRGFNFFFTKVIKRWYVGNLCWCVVETLFFSFFPPQHTLPNLIFQTTYQNMIVWPNIQTGTREQAKVGVEWENFPFQPVSHQSFPVFSLVVVSLFQFPISLFSSFKKNYFF